VTESRSTFQAHHTGHGIFSEDWVNGSFEEGEDEEVVTEEVGFSKYFSTRHRMPICHEWMIQMRWMTR
jgi:hypothetical protein